MSAPRVALVGARRRRQGLGPFVARRLREAGAELVCFLGSSAAGVAQAEHELGQSLGFAPKGYVDLEAMLAREALDALVILSPHETHERYLEATLAAGLHCLCEKPLVWGGREPFAVAQRLVQGFQGTGRMLWENCQLPYLLEGYEALHPGILQQRLQRFEIELSPVSTGEAMLVDTLHHPLSLLQALAPATKAALEGVGFRSQAGREDLEIRFRWPSASPGVEVRVHLRRQLISPRAAALAVNGVWARREIREPGYRMFLHAGARAVPVVDPLARLVSDFVRTLQGAPAPRCPASNLHAIVQRMELLAELVAAYGAREDRT